MRIPLFTSTKSTILFSILCLCFFSVLSSIFALQSPASDQSSAGEEQQEPENLYTEARKYEEEMAAKYTGDAMKWFSKKLDKAVKKDPELQRFFWKGYCDGCDSIVSPDLDQALIEYLWTVPPLTKNIAYDFASIVQPHLDPRISEVSMTDIRGFNTLMNIMTDSIMGQVGEQMVLSRDIAPMGRNYDGKAEKWRPDLMVDIQDIDWILFDEVPVSWPNTNESEQQMAGLINGEEWPTWQWWGDAGRDIPGALGIASSSPVRWVAAETCWPGWCPGSVKKINTQTTNFLKNNSYNFKPQGSWNTLESIFGSWTDFMTKYWANRPNPCKIPPTWFFFQWLFDQNASSDRSDSGWLLAEMFSQWVHPVQEVPELLKWFMNRESRTPESEDKQIDDSIARAFKMSGMNALQPEAILVAGAERRFDAGARAATDKNLPASASVNALGYAEVAYNKYIESLGQPMKGAFIKKHSIESAEHLSVAFKEMQARANSMNEYSKTFGTTAEYLNSKGDCLQS